MSIKFVITFTHKLLNIKQIFQINSNYLNWINRRRKEQNKNEVVEEDVEDEEEDEEEDEYFNN